MVKALERKLLRFWKGKMAFLAHLFTKIMEIRRKGGERSQVACEKKNEENRGLIHKNAFEDQLVTFC